MPKRARPLNDPDHPVRRLLLAASAAFSQHGFDQATLEEIAAQAHLPRTGVYYYFPNKLALLVTIVERIQAQFHARLDTIERLSLPPDLVLAEIIREHVRLICEDAAAMRVLVRETERLPPDTPELQRIVERRQLYRRRVAAIIQRGIESGCFAPVDVALAVEAVVAVANSVMDWLPSHRSWNPAAVSESCAQLAVRALRPDIEARDDRA